MSDEAERVRRFAELVGERHHVRLDEVEARALYLRLVELYKLLIRTPPKPETEEPRDPSSWS